MKLFQCLLLLFGVFVLFQISVAFKKIRPGKLFRTKTTKRPVLNRTIEPRVPCGPDELYDCCDQNHTGHNTCCFGFRDFNDSDTCIKNQNCKYFVTYHYDNDTHYSHTLPNGTDVFVVDNNTEYGWINFTMESTAGVGYTAYAISTDDKMGADLVVVCEVTRAYEVKVYLAWNFEKENHVLNLPKRKKDKIFQLASATYANNKMRCVFAFSTKFTLVIRSPAYYNFSMVRDDPASGVYFGLLAGGRVVNGKLLNHYETYITAFVNNRWSYTNYCRLEGDIPVYFEERLHASYMVVLFTFMLPVTTFVARFYKDSFSRKVFLGRTGWMLTHMIIGMSSFFMMTAAYIFVAAHRNYLKVRMEPAVRHSTMGLTVMAIFGVQFCCGFYRTGASFEKATMFLHSILGWLLHFAGNITVIFAPFYTYNILPCSFAFISATWMIVHIGFYIAITYIMYTADLSQNHLGHRTLLSYPITQLVLPQGKQYPKSRLRKGILTSFVIVAALFTVVLLFFLIVDAQAPCWPVHKTRTRHMNQRRLFK